MIVVFVLFLHAIVTVIPFPDLTTDESPEVVRLRWFTFDHSHSRSRIFRECCTDRRICAISKPLDVFRLLCAVCPTSDRCSPADRTAGRQRARCPRREEWGRK